MTTNEITEVLNRRLSQELLARDLTRLAYVAKDGTPRNVPIAFSSRAASPHSSASSRAAAPAGASPSSIFPDGSSSVRVPEPGLDCLTRTSSPPSTAIRTTE